MSCRTHNARQTLRGCVGRKPVMPVFRVGKRLGSSELDPCRYFAALLIPAMRRAIRSMERQFRAIEVLVPEV